MGAGRKPKHPAEKQGHPVSVNFTEAEYQAVREVAGDEPVASFVRRAILRLLSRRRRR